MNENIRRWRDIPWKDGEALFFIELKVINLTKTTTEALSSDGSFSFKGEGEREGGGDVYKINEASGTLRVYY